SAACGGPSPANFCSTAIRFRSWITTGLRQYGQRIGYLPHEPAPIGFLSAFENVTLALTLRGSTINDATERADAALRLVGLAERSRQRVERLSAGEGQRVALARALACARGLLVVDAPTSRLDTDSSTTVAVALCEASAEGQTVVWATHDPDLI